MRIAGVADSHEPRRSWPAYVPVGLTASSPAAPSRWASPDGPVLFALANSRALANGVAERLGTTIEAHEERDFEDGEHKIRPLVSVRNRSVYVFADLVTSPGQSVNDKLCKLLFFVGALKQSAARSVTVVAPYLCYARKERQTKPRDPVATRRCSRRSASIASLR